MTAHDTTSVAEIHALATDGRYGQALALANRRLAESPHDPELLFARAAALFDWGRTREAYQGFLRAEAAGLSRTALYLNLAWTSHLMRRMQDAEHYARKAIASNADSPEARIGLATILQRMKRYAEAIAAWEDALARNPESGSCAAGIAYCRIEQRDYEGAEEWLRRAIALTPDSTTLLVNLGVALAGMERFAEALAVFERAATMEVEQGLPPYSAIDRAHALIDTGQDHAVVDMLRPKLPQLLDPRAYTHYAFALLALGHFREGWDQYEIRWLQEPHLSHRPGLAKPVWAGQPLDGKTVLIRAEQGAGDIVQFARYAIPLKARGARVVMEVRPELVRLAAGFAGVDYAYAPPAPAPAIDYYVHVMGLPRAFGTDLASVPRDVPYLRVDPAVEAQWAQRIDGRALRVGLAWAGNPLHPRDRHRSMALAQLHELFAVPGIDFYSLQKQPKEGELEGLPVTASLTDLSNDLTDFEATAGAISQMDLVICVDTAVAHIAGALAKPVWLLLPGIGDFRWLIDREDSPWYPSARLFRQREHGDWAEVIARVRVALTEAARAGAAAAIGAPAAPAPDIVADPVARDGIARVTEARHGLFMYAAAGDAERAARCIDRYGEYLEPQLRLLLGLLPPGAAVIEAAAGFGAHAVPLARHLGPHGHLWLYESDISAQTVLRQNLEVNQVAAQVTLMRRSLAGPAAADMADTVDSLQVERLDLLKLGAGSDAREVVDGAVDTLWRTRPIVFAATNGGDGLSRRLRELGYRTWQMRTALFDAGNFNVRDDDIFAGESALAVLAIPEEREVSVPLDGCEEIGSVTAPDADAAPASVESGRDGSALSRWVRKLLG